MFLLDDTDAGDAKKNAEVEEMDRRKSKLIEEANAKLSNEETTNNSSAAKSADRKPVSLITVHLLGSLALCYLG